MNKVWLKRIIFGFVFLFLIGVTSTSAYIAGLASGFLVQTQTTSLSEEVIAGEDYDAKIGIIRLDGVILTSGVENPLSSQGIITASQVKRWLREAMLDENLKALVLEVNSPGGSPVASDEIYQAIKAVRQSGRSVVVVMEDTAASGAYFFSAAADKILANPATLTGSIGVISEITNIEELLNKIGVNVEVYKSGEYKDFTSPTRERTVEEKQMIQDFVDSAFNLFVSRVVEGRGMDEAKVRSLAKGQVFSGEQALEVGLIDQIGSVEDGVTVAQNLEGLTNVKIVRYRTESAFDLLLGRVGAAFNPLNLYFSQLAQPGINLMYLPSF